MEDETKYWVWLSSIQGLGAKTIQKLLEEYKTPKKIWDLCKNDHIKIDGIGEKTIEKLTDEKKQNKH